MSLQTSLVLYISQLSPIRIGKKSLYFTYSTMIVLKRTVVKEYWKALLMGTGLGNTKINDVLRVVHIDIVNVWNLENPKNPVESRKNHVNVCRIHPYRHHFALSPVLESDRPQVLQPDVCHGVGVGAHYRKQYDI